MRVVVAPDKFKGSLTAAQVAARVAAGLARAAPGAEVVEVILERVTKIAMGTELDNVTEFEELALRGEDAPTAISLLD